MSSHEGCHGAPGRTARPEHEVWDEGHEQDDRHDSAQNAGPVLLAADRHPPDGGHGHADDGQGHERGDRELRDTSWGRIVNLASNTLALAVPNMVAYLASKGAVVGFTRALANDLAPYRITVNAVCPTASRTPGMAHVGDEQLQTIANMQAIKRIGTPQDVVGAVCFLSSEDSAFITGQTVVSDGGLMRV